MFKNKLIKFSAEFTKAQNFIKSKIEMFLAMTKAKIRNFGISKQNHDFY